MDNKFVGESFNHHVYRNHNIIERVDPYDGEVIYAVAYKPGKPIKPRYIVARETSVRNLEFEIDVLIDGEEFAMTRPRKTINITEGIDRRKEWSEKPKIPRYLSITRDKIKRRIFAHYNIKCDIRRINDFYVFTYKGKAGQGIKVNRMSDLTMDEWIEHFLNDFKIEKSPDVPG